MTTTTRTRWLLAIVALTLVGVLAGGVWFYREQHDYVRGEVEENLNTIAELKVREIALWRRERLADAHVLLNSTCFIEGAISYLADESPDGEAAIRSRFSALCAHYGYADALLVAPDGEVRLSRHGETERLDAFVIPTLEKALSSGTPAIADLHGEASRSGPHVSIIVPLRSAGAVVLVGDAGQFLYPLVESWPAVSESAETLLVRRDGDHVLFLNEPRHQPGSALNLRMPLTRTDVPAVLAVQGVEGVAYGTDYRGVEVVSVLKRVPDSPWFMISKVDTAEVFAPWRYRAILIFGLFVAGLLLIVAAASAVWHRNETVRYAALLREEMARHEGEERYRVTLMSVGDGVIVTDAEGRVQLLNPVAETLTGWREADARGKPLEEVFRIVNEESRAKVENPVRRVVREGLVVGLANHTVLIARDGTDHAIADSGAPIRGDDGKLAGVVLVFRDRTAERGIERAVEIERNNIQGIMAASPVGLLVLDGKAQIANANPAAERLLGRKLADLRNRRCGDFIACPRRNEDPRGCGHAADCSTCLLLSAVREALATGRGVFDREAEVAAENAGADPRWLRFSVEAVTLDGKRHVVMALDDITESKRAAEEVNRLVVQGEKDRAALLGILEDQQAAREAVQASESQLKRAQEIARMGNWAWDVRGRQLTWSDALRRIWGVADDFPLTEESVNAMIHPDDCEKNAAEVWTLLKSGTSTNFDFRIVRPDGEVRHLHQVAEIVRGPDGDPLRAFGIMQDITDRTQTETAIREQLQELRRWQSVTLDREDRVLELKREVNELAAKLGGKPRYESAGEG